MMKYKVDKINVGSKYTYCNDSIWHPGLLFTFDASREATYSRWGAYMYSAQGTYLFFEKKNKCLKKDFNTV